MIEYVFSWEIILFLEWRFFYWGFIGKFLRRIVKLKKFGWNLGRKIVLRELGNFIKDLKIFKIKNGFLLKKGFLKKKSGSWF